MPTKKLKIVNWTLEVNKAGAAPRKQMQSMFIRHKKECIARHLTRAQGDALWHEKYADKHEALDRKMNAVYSKLWDKYHTKDGRVKAGYKIVY